MTIPASRLASHSNPGHMQVVGYYLSMSATTTGLLLRRITSTVQMLQRTEKPRFIAVVDWVKLSTAGATPAGELSATVV